MLKTLKIDRSKWATGNPPDTSEDQDNCLLNSNGMCCLGFYARQAGYAAKTIRNKGMPADIWGGEYGEKRDIAKGKIRMDGLVNSRGDNSKVASRLARINDSSRFTNEQREKKIIDIFKKLGTRVIFTGKHRAV